MSRHSNDLKPVMPTNPQIKRQKGEFVGKQIKLRGDNDSILKKDQDFVKKLLEMREAFYTQRYHEKKIHEA